MVPVCLEFKLKNIFVFLLGNACQLKLSVYICGSLLTMSCIDAPPCKDTRVANGDADDPRFVILWVSSMVFSVCPAVQYQSGFENAARRWELMVHFAIHFGCRPTLVASTLK